MSRATRAGVICEIERAGGLARALTVPDYPLKYSQNKKGSNITHTLKSISRTRMNNNILFFE